MIAPLGPPQAVIPPLLGRRIAVTRARLQSGALVESLERLGAEVIMAPAIELVDPPDWRALDDALLHLAEFDWIVFTSANALPRLLGRLIALGLDPTLVTRLPARIVAVGPATARGLSAIGLKPEVVPARFRAESVVEILAPESLAGKSVLIPRALEGRDVLPEALAARGARVVVAPVYAAQPSPDGIALARMELERERLDAVTFTSGAIAQAFVAALGDARAALAPVVRASIGPVTSEALTALGFAPQVEAREATVPALVAALVEHFAGPLALEDTP